jgi:hypothetical protein
MESQQTIREYILDDDLYVLTDIQKEYDGCVKIKFDLLILRDRLITERKSIVDITTLIADITGRMIYLDVIRQEICHIPYREALNNILPVVDDTILYWKREDFDLKGKFADKVTLGMELIDQLLSMPLKDKKEKAKRRRVVRKRGKTVDIQECIVNVLSDVRRKEEFNF